MTESGRAGEFDIIARHFAPLAAGAPGADGLRDDAATFPVPPGHELVVTADALVAGVHFLPDDPPADIAWKALAVNLSDLAAKGAQSGGYLLTAAWPGGTQEDWIAAFAKGLGAAQAVFGVHLLGGDTVSTPGPMTLSITALGTVPAGACIRRSGARAGDLICVTGTIGDGALGLDAVQGRLADLDADARATLAEAYRRPQPPVAAGPALVGLAHASMDISDGLLADLGHLAAASSLAAAVDVAAVPLSGAALQAVAADPARIGRVLEGGDDYQILFTIAPADRDRLAALSVPVTVIGRMAVGQGVTARLPDGSVRQPGQGGWRHF